MNNFDSLFIANRGEIALRILRTARRLGLRVVVGYSDADRLTPAVKEADVAVRLGAGPVGESYLNQDSVIAAALAHGARALHPGYGLLSENSVFARKVVAAGLIWVGPSPDSMDRVASKGRAKEVAERAGVPTVPGHRGAQDLASFQRAATAMGYPVLLKATAGGGGRGIRLVNADAELASGMELARGEALNAFGDGELLLEKYVPFAHHVEVQVFGDHHGHVVHLGERDCSAQRRNQKVIEEAPSPAVSPQLRATLCQQAVALAREAGYTNAGTVEFLVTPDGQHFFLEMNTRLQVEHPITEMITDLDLVEWQLRIADGDHLFAQGQVKFRGHAMEARIYAEDPADGFRPQTGPIRGFVLPPGRVDHFLAEYAQVTPHYDAMLAKVIVHGDSREAALAQLESALGRTLIAGLRTNTMFLAGILRMPDFRAGRMHTRTLDHVAPPVPEAPAPGLIAALASALTFQGEGWSNSQGREHVGLWRIGGDTVRTVCQSHPVGFEVHVQGVVHVITPEQLSKLAHLIDRYGVNLVWNQQTFRVDNALHAFSRAQHVADPNIVFCPMAGSLLKVLVQAGESVRRGQTLAVVEAMKMQMEIRSPRDGAIAEVLARAGTTAKKQETLFRLA